MNTTVQASSESNWEKTIAAYQQQQWLSAHIAIEQQNQRVFTKRVGFADLEPKREFRDDLQFPIASLTKQFTAVAILLLYDQKRLQLHEPILKTLKADNPIWQGKPPTWAEKITIHHLLTHTSGLEDYLDMPIDDLMQVKETDILPTIIRHVKDKPLKSVPGAEFHYSNTGYLLLYAIIEAVADQKNANQFLQETVFRPVGMTQTFLQSPAQEMKMSLKLNSSEYTARYVGDLHNLTKAPVKLKKMRSNLPFTGGAGMVSTMGDLIKWNKALYQGRVLPPHLFALFTKVHVAGDSPQFGGLFKYGYGIFINDKKPSNVIYSHGGWLEGCLTHMSYASGTQLSLIILSNLSPDESQPLNMQFQQLHGLVKLANALQLG